MIAVGVRELKARLSEYIRKVKSGESVLVTDRGEVVAELRAPSMRPDTGSDPLEELVQRGALRRGLRNSPEAYQPSELRMEEGTSDGILKWLRGEGELLGNVAAGRAKERNP